MPRQGGVVGCLRGGGGRGLVGLWEGWRVSEGVGRGRGDGEGDVLRERRWVSSNSWATDWTMELEARREWIKSR